MRKLGGSLAFVSGLLTLVFGVIGILVVKDIVSWHWAVSFVDKLDAKNGYDISHTITFATYIVFGVLELFLGYWSMEKARGFASFILLLIFAGSFGFGIFNGIHSGAWGTSTIVVLVVNGIAAAGLLVGITKGNK